ncbi:proteasome regulatory subunit-related [Schistosoma mansoni]|uniref:Proteasome regulatory subunit-related n=1 Tax=Schistosoma mansoni TaxID=6183 RepID=G4LX66_SCHMA|nr:proteasome regulatory subunit-related [Schistosoma mansoni]|eukprot:XP_018645855.1 proteasome regulatory subunit-related [Schistosoma mansoni]
MDDKIQHKMEVDYSVSVDNLLVTVKSLLAAGNFESAVEQCVSLEKQTRTASDAISTGRLLEAIVEILAESSQWSRLNEHLILMTKKHGQMKQSVSKMVQKAMEYLDKTPSEPVKLELIEALRNVTEGKIYVETERARLTKELARIKESHGDIEGAAAVLQDLQVETFGSMEKKEKVEFMLEQMRLCLAKKDFIRTQIISNKISTKFFADAENEDLKLKFYNLMINLNAHDSLYLNISKNYWEIYNSKSVQEDEQKRLLVLRHVIIYLLLSPYDNEQHDLMCRRKLVKDMEKIQIYFDMLKAFTTQELLKWDEFSKLYEHALRTETDVFSKKTDESECETRWRDLHLRVIEHNIRVISEYYTRIRLHRLSQLLDLDIDKTEEYLSKLVVNKTIYAKIDRLEGVVHFIAKKMPTEVLNDWSYNTRNLMALINQTTHLINKERMIHGV